MIKDAWKIKKYSLVVHSLKRFVVEFLALLGSKILLFSWAWLQYNNKSQCAYLFFVIFYSLNFRNDARKYH